MNRAFQQDVHAHRRQILRSPPFINLCAYCISQYLLDTIACGGLFLVYSTVKNACSNLEHAQKDTTHGRHLVSISSRNVVFAESTSIAVLSSSRCLFLYHSWEFRAVLFSDASIAAPCSFPLNVCGASCRLHACENSDYINRLSFETYIVYACPMLQTQGLSYALSTLVLSDARFLHVLHVFYSSPRGFARECGIGLVDAKRSTKALHITLANDLGSGIDAKRIPGHEMLFKFGWEL